MGKIRFLTLVSCVILALGCGGYQGSSGLSNNGSGGNSGVPTSIQGPWEFTTASNTLNGERILIEIDLTQSGNTLSAPQLEVFTGNATFLAPFSGCPAQGQINFSGNLSGTALTASVSSGTNTVQLAGQVASDGRSMTGTYSGGCIAGDNGGTFTASAIAPLSGGFSGTLLGPHNDFSPTTMQASFDSSSQQIAVTGQGNESGNLFNFTFTGSQIGADFSGGGGLTIAAATPTSVIASGHLDPTARTLDHFTIVEPNGMFPVVLFQGTLAK